MTTLVFCDCNGKEIKRIVDETMLPAVGDDVWISFREGDRVVKVQGEVLRRTINYDYSTTFTPSYIVEVYLSWEK